MAEQIVAVRLMKQVALYPIPLAELVAVVAYRPGWSFRLTDMGRGQGSSGLTLVIHVETVDSYHPERPIAVNHLMPVPPANYDRRSWRRWLFEQCQLVDRHEGCEFFRLATAQGEEHPYAPSHGPGNDPYMVREVGTREDQQLSFRGEINADDV